MLTVRNIVALLLAGAASVAQAGTPARVAASGLAPLMVAAIDAPDGHAHGVLTGPMAGRIGQAFAATSPLYVDVSTLVRYAQPGCRRLRVLVWQEGVRFTAGAPAHRESVEFGINYCRDGLPPRALTREGT